MKLEIDSIVLVYTPITFWKPEIVNPWEKSLLYVGYYKIQKRNWKTRLIILISCLLVLVWLSLRLD